MKFIAGLRVWVNGALGKTPQVFPRIRGSANRRVDLHVPLIASISSRRQGDASKCEMSRLGRISLWGPPAAIHPPRGQQLEQLARTQGGAAGGGQGNNGTSPGVRPREAEGLTPRSRV